jgi:PKD repeat protein
VQFDASASADADGSIGRYRWNFGDNSATTGSVATTSHEFQAAGTYTVTLTVTDNLGAVGSTTRSVTVDAPVGGLWFGTATISGQGELQLAAIVAEDGRVYFLQEDGVMYWGTVESSGEEMAATLQGAGLLALPLYDGSAYGTASLRGTIEERTTIAAGLTFTTELGDKTTSAFSLEYDPHYEDASSLASIAGNYEDAMGLHAGVLSISSNGTLFLQDPDSGCVVNGGVAIIDPTHDAYEVLFSYSSCTGPDARLNGVAFTGLAAYFPDLGELLVLVHGAVNGVPYPEVFDLYRP